MGARLAIPPERNEEVARPAWIYSNRNLVERLWAQLKERRALATRCERTCPLLSRRALPRRTMDWLNWHQTSGERRPDAAVVVVSQRAQRRRPVPGEGRAMH
jgi:hypothetical protein